VKGKGQVPGLSFNLPSARKTGKVLSVDAKDNLLVIDLGRQDDVKQGNRCIILKDEKEMASGEVISVRYNVSAVFVDDLKFNNKISNIKEGNTALIKEE
jgi:hypothetical protein